MANEQFENRTQIYDSHSNCRCIYSCSFRLRYITASNNLRTSVNDEVLVNDDIPVTSNDEIGTLSKTFNDMSKSFRHLIIKWEILPIR